MLNFPSFPWSFKTPIQIFPFLDLPKMANGKAKWQMLQCLIWTIFDIQTINLINCEGLKEVSHKFDIFPFKAAPPGA